MELEKKATMESGYLQQRAERCSVFICSKQTEMCCIVLKAEEAPGFVEKGP